MPRGVPNKPRVRTAAQLANDQRMKEEAQRGRDALEEIREAQQAAQQPIGDFSPAYLAAASRSRDAETIAEDILHPPQPEPAIEEEYVSTEDMFGQAANLFAKAQTEGRLSRAETTQLEAILGKIDPMRNPEIADNPAVQAFVDRLAARKAADPGLRPGQLMGSGLSATKKPWTHQDVMQRMLEWINTGQGEVGFRPQTFTPMETTNIIWNGLGITVIAREAATVPECYWEIFNNSYVALISAEQHVQLMFKSRDRVDPAKADVTIMGNPATARVRGAGQGFYRPGAGSIGSPEDEGAA